MPSHILYTCQEKKRRVKKIIIIHAQLTWNQILKANKKTNWKEYAKFNDFLKSFTDVYKLQTQGN